MTRVKICCIANTTEMQMAVAAGASAVGLVSEMPSGPGVLSEIKITEIASFVPAGIASFLLTSKISADDIIRQQHKCGTNTIQLVDAVPMSELKRLRAALPGIGLVQVIHVQDESATQEAVAVAPLVDAVLLDSGNPAAIVKMLGGTGQIHDWSISRKIVALVKTKVWLAGGLNAANVGEAIKKVRPFGVDVCSKVRTDGQLDVQKLTAFMTAVAAAG